MLARLFMALAVGAAFLLGVRVGLALAHRKEERRRLARERAAR